VKVTSEMVERALDVVQGHDCDEHSVRAALEAALEDEREPITEAGALRVQLDAAVRDRESILKRYKALEAKLAKVRGVLDMTRKLTPEVMAICDDLARALAEGGP
jgi:flagellar motility protein MotE (MotC chaperone)